MKKFTFAKKVPLYQVNRIGSLIGFMLKMRSIDKTSHLLSPIVWISH